MPLLNEKLCAHVTVEKKKWLRIYLKTTIDIVASKFYK